jgi:hypothetical protein
MYVGHDISEETKTIEHVVGRKKRCRPSNHTEEKQLLQQRLCVSFSSLGVD